MPGTTKPGAMPGTTPPGGGWSKPARTQHHRTQVHAFPVFAVPHCQDTHCQTACKASALYKPGMTMWCRT